MIGVRSCFLLAEIGIGIETGPGNHQGSSGAWLIPNGNCSAYRTPLLCGEQDCPARKGEGKKQDLTPSMLGLEIDNFRNSKWINAAQDPDGDGEAKVRTEFSSWIDKVTNFDLVDRAYRCGDTSILQNAQLPKKSLS
jgi:hypothetical protein